MNIYFQLMFIVNDMAIITNGVKIVNVFGNKFHCIGKIHQAELTKLSTTNCCLKLQLPEKKKHRAVAHEQLHDVSSFTALQSIRCLA